MNNVIEKLIADIPHTMRNEAEREIAEPGWGRGRRHNDWRNYITPALRAEWNNLSFEARLTAYVVAASQAFCD